ATAPIRESVFFLGNESSSFASFQSGRIALKILLCFTWPAITARVTPSLCNNSMALLSSPRLTQCTRFAACANSGEASSLSAITAISMPWLRAPSSTRNGNRPFPAISPQPFLFASISNAQTASRPLPALLLLHDPALRLLHEIHQFFYVRGISPCLPHFCQCLRSILLRSQQQPERPLQRLNPLRRKSLALQPDGVWAEALRLPLGHHE